MIQQLLMTYKAAAAGLTQYPSGVSFAVSTREIPGLSYTGLLFRVRRSSDNAELDFYKGAAEWVDYNTTRGGGGTDLATWVGSNTGFIVEWYRQDGSGGKMAQTTAGNQPRIIDAGTLLTSGGFPCVQFNVSNNNMMVISGTGLPSNLVPHTSLHIGNRRTSATYGTLMSRSGSVNGWSIARWGNDKVTQRTTDGQDEANSTNATTSFEVLAAKATSTTHSMDTQAGNIASTHSEVAYGTIDFNNYCRWDSAGVYGNQNVVEHLYWNGLELTNYSDTIAFAASEVGL